jgi:diaminohydroxyphosphoribosylaminopyrimidine deaminase / 5-amino-6-(5-phosphoribosylamino)uracil reductase
LKTHLPHGGGPQAPGANPEADVNADAAHVSEALRCAEQALLRASPNPRVGCVIVDTLGRVVGRRATQPAGQAHAEVMAMRDAREHGFDLRGATAYVTLEPCSHHGRTGPCCQALAEAGIGRVVASVTDPNPLVAGRGLAYLQSHGVEVEVGPGAAESMELNIGFFSRMIRKRPWVRMKSATSFDGVSALSNGASQWITSAPAREDGHAWRARACAILTGIGTVEADDPRLDVRTVETPRQPMLVLVDSQLKVSPDAALFAAQRPVYIYTAAADADKAARLRARGAEVIEMPAAGGGVDLARMLEDLAVHRQVNELHVEAGAALNGALLGAGLVDELLHYWAPRLLGPGRPMALLPTLSDLTQGVQLDIRSVRQIGPDLRVVARLGGHDEFLGATA